MSHYIYGHKELGQRVLIGYTIGDQTSEIIKYKDDYYYIYRPGGASWDCDYIEILIYKIDNGRCIDFLKNVIEGVPWGTVSIEKLEKKAEDSNAYTVMSCTDPEREGDAKLIKRLEVSDIDKYHDHLVIQDLLKLEGENIKI